MKGAVIMVAAFAGFFAFMVIVWTLIFAWNWVTASPKGKLQARQQILSGDNRIQAYNHFFDLCASVQTAETAIDTSMEQLKQSQTAEDKSRIETNMAAQRINRADAVNQYNQDAQKSYTIGQFKSLKLPWQLPIQYEGEHTVCATSQ